MAQGLPVAAADNPLGFQLDAQGQIPALEVDELEGEARELRLNQCAAFCRFLDGRDGFIEAFNCLQHYQQVLAVLLHEVLAEHLNLVKDHYLRTLADLRTLAITQSTANSMITSVVTKEVELRYIAGFFKVRRNLGMHERMAPAPKEGAGGGLQT